ncbi:YjbH domain-containing protein [Halomonas beimenensis]|uniref:Putative outer membrane lipoprotein n=1 Tax=Halomonas beimenensis TaxID=475662 RepID=A0A291P6Z6_9GAMM|nr:YjbH domain-containing protein [Halomonas beimenensis]ATJ82648.1 putative outer membrane lipoprotein [Halomonas beimenensis]
MLLASSPLLANELGTGQSDFGGIGLMQTPTARMGEVGHFAIGWNRTEPYRRVSIFAQPLDWIEVGFRYVSVENRLFGESIAGDRDYLDKGIDAKVRLREESRYWPELAVGLRDAGGTTLFGAEYLAASKRWHDLDFTLGLGWGYLGNAADGDSPLEWVDDRFATRPTDAGGDQGGEFALDQLFRGPMAVFGGIEYQTPWDPLLLQLEYEGNDYSNEPSTEDLSPDSRFNLGARLRLSDSIELRAGWQRGNELMAGINLSTNLAGLSQVKQDPPPRALDAHQASDWPTVAADLRSNAGIRVHEIRQADDDLTVIGEPMTYRHLTQSEGRAGRILQGKAAPEVETFRFRWQGRGLDLREDVHDRDDFVAAARSRDAEPRHRYGIYAYDHLTDDDASSLYQADPRRFTWQIGPGVEQNFGGPDGYLYRLFAAASAEVTTDANGWFSGELTATVADNLDKYDYIADSDLPRVRTFIGDYLSESTVGITSLQYNRTARLGDDVFAMGYGGLLEMMYAGAGGELLYRPFNAGWALGLDVNRVRQRDFDQRFALRDYETWTGHATAYVDTGMEDILAKLSVGRYLAGDVGATLDMSREFDNGVRIGAWATFTDAGDDFGEGGFDKAFYITLPLDAFFVRSSRDQATIAWQPLTRDGGARLNRRHELYDITAERELGRYWESYDKTWD